MNSNQSNHLAMYLAVQGFLTEFLNSTTATSRFPILTGEAARLETLTDQIQNYFTTQRIPLAAPIEARELALDLAQRRALAVGGILFAYARKHGLAELEVQTRLTPSTFTRMRVEQRMYVAQRLYDLAKPLEAQLADMGVTATTLADFQTVIDTAKAAVEGRVDLSADKKVAFDHLPRLFTETDRHLEVIDGLLLQLRETDLATHDRYLAARRVFDRPGTRSSDDDTATAPAATPAGTTAPTATGAPAAPPAAQPIAA